MNPATASATIPRRLGGTFVTLSPREPVLLAEPESAWLVLEGRVDLFLLRKENDHPSGARNHLVRIEKDHAFFGLNWSVLPAGWCVMMVSAPETTVLKTTIDDILAAAANSSSTKRVYELIEHWIATLSRAAAGDLPPKHYIPLEPGSSVTIPRQTQPLSARETLVWVQHVEGTGLFLGNPDIPGIGGDVPFPLANPAWVKEEPQNKIIAISSEDALKSATALPAIEHFHRVIFSALIWNVETEKKRERQRLIARQEMDDARLDRALRQLSLPLRKDTGGLNLDDAATALMAACKIVGLSQGIEFRTHPELARDAAVRDPVAAIAKASGVRFRRVILADNWWQREGGPLLAFHESSGRPLALLPKDSHYQYLDPVELKHGSVTEDFAASLEPHALSFYRTFPPETITARRLVLFGMHGCGRDVFTIVIMGLLTGLLSLAMPIMTGTLFDTIIPGAQRRRLLELGIFIASSSLASVLFQLTRGFATLRIEGKMEAVVQAAVWDRLATGFFLQKVLCG